MNTIALTSTGRQLVRQEQISELPDLLTIEEFRREARIGRSAAYELARTGAIPGVRLGRLIRVHRSALEPIAQDDNRPRRAHGTP